MIEQSQDVTELFKALHAAQGSLTGVKRDSVNPHFRNRYASLEAVIDAAKGPLHANGLVFTQAPGAVINGAVEITTMLMHTSGQWLRSTLHVPLAKTDPQGVGSAITYGCRYTLMAALGLPPVDDDAEAAVGRPANGAAKTDTATAADLMISAINTATSAADLAIFAKDNHALFNGLSKEQQKRVAAAKQAKINELSSRS